MTTVELVRHAQAHRHEAREAPSGRVRPGGGEAEPLDAGGSDHRRPLDDLGNLQARELAATLAAGHPPVRALYSSPSVRCEQTLRPLAEALGLPVEPVPELAMSKAQPPSDAGDAWVDAAWLGARTAAWLEGVRAEAGPDSRIVACTHGDVLPALLAFLAGRDQIETADLACPPAGRVTLLLGPDGCCTDARRHPPPRLDQRIDHLPTRPPVPPGSGHPDDGAPR